MATIEEIKDNVLSKVKQEEEEKAQREKEKIKQKTEEQLKQIDSESENQRARFKKSDEQAEKNKQQQIKKAQRSKELEMQDHLVQDVFSKALDELNELSADELYDLIDQALTVVPDRDTVLLYGANNAHTLSDAQIQDLQAKHQHVTVSNETVRRAGGFILSQDAVDYNYTFSALLAEVENALSASFIQMAEDEEE
ncbi:MAG: V-type ATP synthase subunit E [Aerococcus sp.]|nr:V-type ATP synthase subunit E [Aerococcus sp.]